MLRSHEKATEARYRRTESRHPEAAFAGEGADLEALRGTGGAFEQKEGAELAQLGEATLRPTCSRNASFPFVPTTGAGGPLIPALGMAMIDQMHRGVILLVLAAALPFASAQDIAPEVLL